MKQGLVLNKVVLLGRTLEEYRHFFCLNLESWKGSRILDVAAGVSSFRYEAHQAGLDVTAFDAIYGMDPDEIKHRCEADLDHVVQAIQGLKTYRWDFYKSPKTMRQFREAAYRSFLTDYRTQGSKCYVPGLLPELPFADASFDLSLVSYLMFVYEDQFDYEFHKQALLEIMRVTRGEARFYPITTFEARRSNHLDRLKADPEMQHLGFDEVPTNFEFLVNSNFYLRVFRR